MRVRKERETFWPKFCYSVRVTIEAGPFTPMSSRRASVATDVDVPRQSDSLDNGERDVPLKCHLLLSYVTTSAHWVPSYELKLSTTDGKGALRFDAELHNTSSETWSNCKVSLSTSQATFSGLDDAIPELTPWYMSLATKPAPHGIDHWQKHMCRTNEERESMTKFRERQTQPSTKKLRSEMFGARGPMNDFELRGTLDEEDEEEEDAGDSGLFDSLPPSRSGPAAPAAAPMLRASVSRFVSQVGQRHEQPQLDMLRAASAEPNMDNEADFVVEETGLTTNFDLPGLKTLAPKNTPSKSLVAHTTFTNVEYSHVAVAKCKPVAYSRPRSRTRAR